jgi:hypothetical protein
LDSDGVSPIRRAESNTEAGKLRFSPGKIFRNNFFFGVRQVPSRTIRSETGSIPFRVPFWTAIQVGVTPKWRNRRGIGVPSVCGRDMGSDLNCCPRRSHSKMEKQVWYWSSPVFNWKKSPCWTTVQCGVTPIWSSRNGTGLTRDVSFSGKNHTRIRQKQRINDYADACLMKLSTFLKGESQPRRFDTQHPIDLK